MVEGGKSLMARPGLVRTFVGRDRSVECARFGCLGHGGGHIRGGIERIEMGSDAPGLAVSPVKVLLQGFFLLLAIGIASECNFFVDRLFSEVRRSKGS